jgi:hypothetical protein
MATKKKAAKKKSGTKKATKVLSASALKFNPRIHGDPPPIWLKQLDVIRQRELVAWVNAVIQKVGR